MKPSEEQLKDLISEISGVENNEIYGSTTFKGDLGMDSIALADLVASLEEDYDVIVEPEQAIGISNFSQLLTFIDQI